MGGKEKRHASGMSRTSRKAPTTLPIETEAEPSSCISSVVCLSSHAAVRLEEVPDRWFDANDLPVARTQQSSRAAAFGRSLRGLVSYLTTRINPLFQECQVKISESVGGLHFEVRLASSLSRVVFAAPLDSLVDVSADSVVEKETVTFSQLPREYGTNGSMEVAAARDKAPLAKELMSNILRACGEIGLNLTFKAASGADTRAEVIGERPNLATHFAKVRLRFVSTAERDRWLTFCTEVYAGLLITSIRIDHRFANETAVGQTGTMPALTKPSTEAVHQYINFFLSTPAKKGGSVAGAGSIPCEGALRVRWHNSKPHLCRLSLEGMSGDTTGGDPDGGSERLVIERVSLAGRLRPFGDRDRTSCRRISLHDITVYVDEEVGTNFFLDYAAPTHSCEDALEVLKKSFSEAAQNSLRVSSSERTTITVEMLAGSKAERAEWLKWFELVLGHPILLLSALRRSAEAAIALPTHAPPRLLLDGDGYW